MKTLEQLGISPTPWSIEYDDTIDRVVNIFDAKKKIIVETDYGFYPPELPDARLMKAAPELYDAGQKTEAVLTGLFKLDEFAALLKSGAADALIACRDELRKALVNAAGESEVKE